MIIDSHFHIDERIMTVETLLAKMDNAGVDRAALMAALNDPFPEPAPWLVGLGHFILYHRPLRALGKRMVAHFTPDGDIRLPMGTYRIYRDPDNAPVFDAVKRHPSRFRAWVFVNPRGAIDPVGEIVRWKDAPGFIGIKAHPFWHRFAPSELLPAAEQAVKLEKPLLIHAGFGDHGDFMPLVRELPGLKLILAHAAFPEFSDSWRTIKPHKNIFVDLSQTTYVGEKTTTAVVEYLDADRCLFGTDGPFGPPEGDGTFDYGYIKRRLETLFPDEKTRRLLLGENFSRLAGV